MHNSRIARVFSLIFSLALFVLTASSAQAQKTIYLYSDANAESIGFVKKLDAALQKSAIATRYRSATIPSLDGINASKVGDLVAQVQFSEMRCEGKTLLAVSLVFFELQRDKVGSVIKVCIGSTTGFIREATLDSDADQYAGIIVSALSTR